MASVLNSFLVDSLKKRANEPPRSINPLLMKKVKNFKDTKK